MERKRTGPRPALALGAVLLVTVIAGCGGDSSGDDTAEAGAGASQAAGGDQALAYAQCMRENGVPEFPDPVDGRLQLRAGPGTGLDPSSPEFQAAREACQSEAPPGLQAGSEPSPELQESALEFARCMRENGVPEFPDPAFDGGGLRMQLPQGVDPNSRRFEKARQECGEILAGVGGAP